MRLDLVSRYAFAYLRKYGLIERGWSFRFDGAKRRLGLCDYDERVICVSREHAELNDFATVRDTILHEIAHAIIGPGKGHGKEWQAMARQIGAIPTARKSPPVSPQPKLLLWCIECRKVVGGLYRRTESRFRHTECDSLVELKEASG
jgi:predicted SprT family Zn-dependent metalloprotease